MKKTMKKVVDAEPRDKDVAMLHSPMQTGSRIRTPPNLAATGEARKKQKILGKVITER
jgi:hypothetical protein